MELLKIMVLIIIKINEEFCLRGRNATNNIEPFYRRKKVWIILRRDGMLENNPLISLDRITGIHESNPLQLGLGG